MLMSCERGQQQFTLLSHKRTGITFRNTIQETEEFNHLAYSYLYNGAGVATGDINNDGLPDIYFTGNLVKSRLYLNRGHFRFRDISAEAGVSAADTWNNGASMADVNGDGFLDIYVCSSTDGRPRYRKNKLFINNGDLTFTDRAAAYGLDDPAYSTHSAFLDYDKDGDLDLFVINHSVDKYAMFTQDSPEHKKEHAPQYGHKLYRNDGEHFTEVTREAGILSNVINFGLGIAVSDFNNDHWPDIYICNDFYEQDYFYINQQNGTFSEQLDRFFGHVSFSSMGNDAADFNNDGDIDLLTLDMLPEENKEQKLVEGPHNYERFSKLETWGFYHQTTRNMLQMNCNGEHFIEIGQYAGIFSTNWSWSPLLCDFDNDGLKDLFISNGYGKNNTHMDALMMIVKDMQHQQRGGEGMTNMEVIDQIPATILKNYLFRNNGDSTFSNVGVEWGFDQVSLSNGAAYADLDNDGDMDLVVNNINEYAYIFRNNADRLTGNHYLRIKLEGSGMNTGGIGARIDVTCGKRVFTQESSPSRGYMSTVDQTLVFGLGDASMVDQLTITWPDMRSQTLRNVAVDRTLTLHNGDATPLQSTPPPDQQTIFHPCSGPKPLNYLHRELPFNEFKEQPLLPWLLSTGGPRITSGDVNGDGLDDLFIGGARSFPGRLFLQQQDGTFKTRNLTCFEADRESEDMDVLFVDVDGDGDRDLYVVSGGNEHPRGSAALRDRLYLNNGKGYYSRAEGYLPEMFSSGSCVKAADMDGDGDTDLFVGGRLTPGLYPTAPRSYLLENDGSGRFRDITGEMNPELLRPGLVTDAVWSDFNGDRKPDLILVGEWMPVRLFANSGPGMKEVEKQAWMEQSCGWWNTIESGDFDRDGDPDFILGNMGKNFQIKPTPGEPARIYASDFDHNGSLDAIMCSYIKGKNYPIYSKDDLEAQIPDIHKHYGDYASFADQTISDIIPQELLDNALVLQVNHPGSAYLENLGNNRFALSDLPEVTQFAPVRTIGIADYNGDGNTDLLLAGNFFGNRIKYGRMDANRGLLLTGNGKGGFTACSSAESGLRLSGEVRDMTTARLATGEEILVFAVNSDSLQLYQTTAH